MLTPRLSPIRKLFAPAYQVRWKSQPSNQRKSALDHQRYPSTAFVSFNRKQAPFPAPGPLKITPAKSVSRLGTSLNHKEPSLFTQLFPEEAQKSQSSQTTSGGLPSKFPPLELPTVPELLAGVERYRPGHLTHTRATSKDTLPDTKSHKKTTLLVLELASKSLVESDFRRIAPKGAHIDGWTGPGDILRVFPARDPRTLEQTNHYFILFASPAYARAYENHVHRLYRLARKHTPTSIESPLPPQPGEKIDDEDAYTMLQDFTLCPPSQRIQLKYIYGEMTPGMRVLIERGGYLKLPDGTDLAGRAVLLWVDGNQPTFREIDDLISSDGRKRGMSWDVSIDKLDSSRSTTSEDVEDSIGDEDFENMETSQQRRGPQRWVLTFCGENEARRFIRAWHKRQLPSAHSGEPRIVQAELLW